MVAALAPEYFLVGPVPSDAAAVYGAVLTQLDGVTPIGPGMLQSLTLTLVDEVTRAVINNREGQDVLNKNGVIVDVTGGTGALQWIVSSADNPFVRAKPPPIFGELERHEAIFVWTWVDPNNTTQTGKRKVFIMVESYENLDKPTMGSGSKIYTDFVYQSDGATPVDDALVWVTSDPAGSMFVAGTIQTTRLGQFTFLLDPGTYYVWVKSPSYAMSGPNTIVVT